MDGLKCDQIYISHSLYKIRDMIYTLPYQSEDLLKGNYFKIRNIANPKSDTIHLTVTHSHLDEFSKEELYKKVLHLEGKYRSETNSWTTPAFKIRVINQL